MKVLVTGASGFLGRHVVAALAEQGHAVRALVRPVSERPAELGLAHVEVACADLRGGGLAEVVAGVSTVVHVAAGTSGSLEEQLGASVAATERLLAAMKDAGVKRLVLVSSFSVYDWSGLRWKLDETSPLEKALYARDGYAIAKSWQEKIVREFCAQEGVALTVVRPGFIWGPGHEWIDGAGMRTGKMVLVNGPWRRLPLTYVRNCAECIVALCEHPKAAGETFNIVDGETVRAWRFARQYAKHRRERCICVPLPYFVGLWLAVVASLAGRLMFGKFFRLPGILLPNRYRARFRSLHFSSDKLRQAVGWKSPRSFSACVQETYGRAERQEKVEVPRVGYA